MRKEFIQVSEKFGISLTLTNFNHKNIIEYCNRPFRTLDGQYDVKGMNKTLIRNWNSRVKPEDTIYVIGDVCMGPKEEWLSFTSQLQGRKILALGNHDLVKPSHLKGRTIERFWQDLGFEEVYHELVIEDGGMKLFLKHEPDYKWKEKHPECSYQLCGHVHEAFLYDSINKIYNIGVDVNEYRPVALPEITANISFGLNLTDLWI